MIDRVWLSIEKDRRRNLQNYDYILINLELMGQTELLPQVPLLRTRLRLRQHDLLWKKVCDELERTWKRTEIAYTHQSVKQRQGTYKRKPKPTYKFGNLARDFVCSRNQQTKFRDNSYNPVTKRPTVTNIPAGFGGNFGRYPWQGPLLTQPPRGNVASARQPPRGSLFEATWPPRGNLLEATTSRQRGLLEAASSRQPAQACRACF